MSVCVGGGGVAASVTKDSGIQDLLFSTGSTNELRNG